MDKKKTSRDKDKRTSSRKTYDSDEGSSSEKPTSSRKRREEREPEPSARPTTLVVEVASFPKDEAIVRGEEEKRRPNLLDIIATSFEEENGGIMIPIKREQTDMETDVRDRLLSVFLCNNHGTLEGQLNPATVIVAADKAEAQEILERELSDRGLPSFYQHKYDIIQLDTRQKQVIMLTMEDIKRMEERKMQRESVKDNLVFMCASHDILPPLGPGTVIVDSDNQHAQQMFDVVLQNNELRTFSELPYTFVQVNRTEPNVFILSDGELRM